MQIDYAYRLCKEFTLRHYENFPVGSFLIPADKRKYIYSIYSFARYSDDIADSTEYTEIEKLQKLSELESELKKIYKTDPDIQDSLVKETEFIFIALSHTVNELKIPIEEFVNLLKAFRQDSVKQSYSEFNELINYSALSANPVGHLVLYVFGYNMTDHKDCFKYSDKICTALQLTNFWQDVSVDLNMQRVYIPERMMIENNYSMDMLFKKTENEDFKKIVKILVDKTKLLFLEGKGITKVVDGRLKYELKATIAGGMEILNKIEKIDYSVLSKRVKLSKTEKFKLLGKILTS